MESVVTPQTQAMAADALVPRRDLKRLMRRSNAPGLWHLALWMIVLASTGALVWGAGDALWLLIPAMFLHGIVVVHHFALQHECSHYTAFRSRWICNLLAHICGFILVIPPRFFRYEHCDHHTYTNLHGRDPEMIELPISLGKYLLYLSAIPYWRSQFGGMFRRSAGVLTAEEQRFIPREERGKVIWEGRAMIAGYLTIIGLMATTGWLAPLFYWWLPMFMAEPVMRFIRMTEHVGRPNVPDMRVNTRTNVVSAPWRFLAWNMNYHAEHHYAASVPFYALGDLHHRIRDDIFVERHGYLSAHLDIIRSMARVRAATRTPAE
ncbi:MAG: fatty acid desaturase [Pseudomonadota bacterium]